MASQTPLSRNDIDYGPWFVNKEDYTIMSVSQFHNALDTAQALQKYTGPDPLSEMIESIYYESKMEAYGRLAKILKADMEAAYTTIYKVSKALIDANEDIQKLKDEEEGYGRDDLDD